MLIRCRAGRVAAGEWQTNCCAALASGTSDDANLRMEWGHADSMQGGGRRRNGSGRARSGEAANSVDDVDGEGWRDGVRCVVAGGKYADAEKDAQPGLPAVFDGGGETPGLAPAGVDGRAGGALQ